MTVGLSRRDEFASFVRAHVAPAATSSDKSGCLDPRILSAFRESGYLGVNIDPNYGGLGFDNLDIGMLTAEVARACSSSRTLLTVQGIVSAAVQRWGNDSQRQTYLTRLACGEILAGFALSESDAGSDATAIETKIETSGDQLVVTGRKRWISFGQTANLFLVFGRAQDGFGAVLVPGDTPGLHREPQLDMVGTRAAMMANLVFDGCRVPRDAMLGRPGFGLSHVAATALDYGRFSVAWGSIGIAAQALASGVRFARTRKHSFKFLSDQPLIKARIARVGLATESAKLLCVEAARMRDERSPSAVMWTMAAKYAASKAAVFSANESVQICGARGLLSDDYGQERLLRDAKVTEIIEGSTDVLELALGDHLILRDGELDVY